MGRQLSNRSHQIGTDIHPAHTNCQIKDVMKVFVKKSRQLRANSTFCIITIVTCAIAVMYRLQMVTPASPHRGAKEIRHTSGESSMEKKKTACICNWLIYLIPFLLGGTEGCDNCFPFGRVFGKTMDLAQPKPTIFAVTVFCHVVLGLPKPELNKQPDSMGGKSFSELLSSGSSHITYKDVFIRAKFTNCSFSVLSIKKNVFYLLLKNRII